MLFFAASGERALGGLRPEAMERTLQVIDQELNATQRRIQLPCDTSGNAS
jgi:hypothetical protein